MPDYSRVFAEISANGAQVDDPDASKNKVTVRLRTGVFLYRSSAHELGLRR